MSRRSSAETFTKRFVYNDALPGSAPSINNNSRNFLHFDEAGSTTAVTNDQGNIQISYRITPDGDTVSRSGMGFNPFTFNGALGWMQEGETGLFLEPDGEVYDSTTQAIITPEGSVSFIFERPVDIISDGAFEPGFLYRRNLLDPESDALHMPASPDDYLKGQTVILADGGVPSSPVGRLGLPLINETIIALKDKDIWNRRLRDPLNPLAPADGLGGPLPTRRPLTASETRALTAFVLGAFVGPFPTTRFLTFEEVTQVQLLTWLILKSFQTGIFDLAGAQPNPPPVGPFFNATGRRPRTIHLPQVATTPGANEGGLADWDDWYAEDDRFFPGCAAANFTHLGGTAVQRIAALAVMWLPMGVLALLKRRSRSRRR